VKTKGLSRSTISKFILIIGAMTVNIFGQMKSDPAHALPEEINNWKKSSEDRIFNNETLYDYIDGGAELYLSFGFTKVFNRIYSHPDQPEIHIDIFYMNSSYNAFGVFSLSSGKIEHNYGNQSETTSGAILFWKDSYYVFISSMNETGESAKTIKMLAEMIDKSIPQKGEMPAVLNYLPEKFLDKESIRYFRHYIWLNSHSFISNENILNIDQNTHCVFAKYNGENEKSLLLLIEYPDSNRAATGKNKFVDAYKPGLASSSIIKSEEGRFLGMDMHNNLLMVLFNAESEDGVRKLFQLVKAKRADLNDRWND